MILPLWTISTAASATILLGGTDRFTLRPFSSKIDQEPLSEMCKDVWGGADYLPSTAHMYENDPTCEFLVLEDEMTKEMIAVGNRRWMDIYESVDSTLDQNGTRVWLEAIRVSPKFQNRGIASLLMKELCKRSREDGAQEILSCTIASNTAMMNLFAKDGIDMKPIMTASFPDLASLARLPGWSSIDLVSEDNERFPPENILKAMNLDHLISDSAKSEKWEPIESEAELKKILNRLEYCGKIGHIPAMGKFLYMTDDFRESIEKGLVRRKVSNDVNSAPCLFALVRDRGIQSLQSQYACSIVASTSHDFDAAVWEACRNEYVPLLDENPAFYCMYEVPFPSEGNSVIESFPIIAANTFTYHRWTASSL